MNPEKDMSLDETLQELLSEDASANNEPLEAKPTETKPKRTRRTKAQIEADKKAAEIAASAEPDTEKSADESPDVLEEPKTNSAEDPVVELFTPEVITYEEPDDQEIPASEETSEDANPVDALTPEVVEDTAQDKLPDVIEPKEAPKAKKPPVKDDVVNALKGESKEKVDPNSKVGKSVILKELTPMYRARHLSMKIKPYRGLVTVIEDAKSGFMKVQYLRVGFGLCEGFIEEQYILNLLEGESIETIQET